MEYIVLKWVHLLSATILFGTGLGSAFYKWSADRTGNVATIAHTNKIVVLADWIFTTPTIVVQPLTGVALARLMGIPLTEPWIVAAFILYAVAGSCWLPVVWLQIRMRSLSVQAMQQGSGLDESYQLLARYWFWLGVPAFGAMVVLYFIMVFKPASLGP